MLSTLEALYVARENLRNEDVEFTFTAWRVCTCGHIYAGATGVRADGPDRIVPDTVYNEYGARVVPEYARVILDAAAALGWSGDWGTWPGQDAEWNATHILDAAAIASLYVSDQTTRLAGDDCRLSVQRADAVEIVDRAIRAIEEQEERARRRLLDGARAGLTGPGREVRVEPLTIPDPDPNRHDEPAPAPTERPAEEPIEVPA
jgi:hypothetical protein